MRDSKLKFPTFLYIELSYLSLHPQWQGRLGNVPWELCAHKEKERWFSQYTAVSTTQDANNIWLKNDLYQAYPLRAKMNNFNKIKRTVKTEVYKRLWIYLWSIWYKINALVFLEAYLISALVAFTFPSGILCVVDTANNVGPWLIMCYFP